jgi:hypothetical protein
MATKVVTGCSTSFSPDAALQLSLAYVQGTVLSTKIESFSDSCKRSKKYLQIENGLVMVKCRCILNSLLFKVENTAIQFLLQIL